jgi:hypothetical protein
VVIVRGLFVDGGLGHSVSLGLHATASSAIIEIIKQERYPASPEISVT